MFDTTCTHPVPKSALKACRPKTLIMRARASIKSYGAYYDTTHSQTTTSLNHIRTCERLVWVLQSVGELYWEVAEKPLAATVQLPLFLLGLVVLGRHLGHQLKKFEPLV